MKALACKMNPREEKQNDARVIQMLIG